MSKQERARIAYDISGILASTRLVDFPDHEVDDIVDRLTDYVTRERKGDALESLNAASSTIGPIPGQRQGPGDSR